MKEATIRTFFSAFWNIPETKVQKNLRLDDESLPEYSSLRFYQFIAALESNFEVEISDITILHTVGDLYAQLIN